MYAQKDQNSRFPDSNQGRIWFARRSLVEQREKMNGSCHSTCSVTSRRTSRLFFPIFSSSQLPTPFDQLRRVHEARDQNCRKSSETQREVDNGLQETRSARIYDSKKGEVSICQAEACHLKHSIRRPLQQLIDRWGCWNGAQYMTC